MDTQSKIEELKSGLTFLTKIEIKKIEAEEINDPLELSRIFFRATKGQEIESVLIIVGVKNEDPSYFLIKKPQNYARPIDCVGSPFECLKKTECCYPFCNLLISQIGIIRDFIILEVDLKHKCKTQKTDIAILLEIWAKFIETK